MELVLGMGSLVVGCNSVILLEAMEKEIRSKYLGQVQLQDQLHHPSQTAVVTTQPKKL